MIHKINKAVESTYESAHETQGPLEKSDIGYVVCTDGTYNSTVIEGMVYTLAKDTYFGDDGEYYVDIIVHGSTLHGFYARRFTHLSEEEAHNYVKDKQPRGMSTLGDFK